MHDSHAPAPADEIGTATTPEPAETPELEPEPGEDTPEDETSDEPEEGEAASSPATPRKPRKAAGTKKK